MVRARTRCRTYPSPPSRFVTPPSQLCPSSMHCHVVQTLPRACCMILSRCCHCRCCRRRVYPQTLCCVALTTCRMGGAELVCVTVSLSLSLFSLPLSPPSCAPCLGATSSSPETLTGLSSGEWGGLCSALAVSIADVHAAAYFELSLSFSLFVVSPTFSEATRGATLALCF